MTMRDEKDPNLNFICNHITEKSGIGFDDRKRLQLSEIIKTRCDLLGLNHIRDYWALFHEPAQNHPEFNTLMDILTIQESFFFRHNAQFNALRHFCLPRIMKKKNPKNSRINIWSAGCANGEEAYSIAMLIRDLIPENPETKVRIHGTDISLQAISKAKEGIYTERAIRGLDARYLNRYFSKQENGYVLSPEIKGMVDFAHLNLSEDPFPTASMPLWDIIFCRNVIIYFTADHSRKLMKNFYDTLADGGFLFAGFSETMRYLNEDFVPIQVEDAFIYQKPSPGQEAAAPPSLLPKSALPRSPKKPAALSMPTPRTQIGRPVFQKLKAPHIPASAEKAIFPKSKEPLAEQTKTIDSPLSRAARLADRGETMAAVEILDDIIRQNPLHTQAYFMLAMIYRNAANLDQAAQYLKKVTYLEPGNPLARLHLADIFKETSQKTDAAREYANVISLLENRQNLEKEMLSNGFTGDAILAAARAHLKLMEKTI